MSLIVSVVNQKGGCGKTTTAVHLACAFATLDRRVLVVDLDPQGHAGMALGVEDEDHAPSLSEVLAHSPLSGLGRPLHEAIVAARPGIDCVPANLGLSTLESKLSSVPGREDRLAEHLSDVGRGWELVVIDAPPNLGLLTINALVASHEAIVPIEPSTFSVQGAERVIDTIGLVREMTGHRLEHRLLPTMIGARDRHAEQLVEAARSRWPGRVLHQRVRRCRLFGRAAARGRTLGEVDPRSHAWQDYVRIALELKEIWAIEGRLETPRFRGLRVVPDGVAFDHPILPAHQVLLAGDFNGWEPDRQVRVLQYPGGWEKRLACPPGRYEYKFVLEGTWTPDPWNPRHVFNPHGTENSVIEVPPPVPQGSIFRARHDEPS